MFRTKEAGLFLCPSFPQRDLSAVCSDWHFRNRVSQSLTKQYRGGKLKAQHYLLCVRWLHLQWLCFPSLFTRLISSFWQCTQSGQFCFILIAHFRLEKLVFLDYFDVEMGLGDQFTFVRRYPPTTTHTSMHAYFCANSRIPIYILAVDLNYCKHLCGPARHNRLAGSCIISVPPTGTKQNYTTIDLLYTWHQGLLQTLWDILLCLDSLLRCWNIC